MIRNFLHIITILLVVVAAVCSCKQQDKPVVAPAENLEAKKMLAGIWVDADEESVVFKISGDTIYYPDPTANPVEFKIVKDTMILQGNSVSKYPIIKMAAHLLEFKNQGGDIIKLVKSDNPVDAYQFKRHDQVPLNQGKVVKTDTVVSYNDNRYHSYVQVNPTTYKVYRTSYNSEGMETENIYYDNIVHVSVYRGAAKVFSKDFRKDDFAETVPANMLKQCVLSDIKLIEASDDGLHYRAQLAIPDSPSSFMAELIISYDGKTKVRVFEM